MSSSRSAKRDELPDITSKSRPLCLVPIDLNYGRVYLTTGPGYRGMVWFQNRGACRIHRDMPTDVTRIRAHGITRLVTLMDGAEILDADMGSLEPELVRHGLHWSHLPLPSGAGTEPFFREELADLAKTFRRELKAGQTLAFHADDWEYRIEVYLPSILCELDRTLTSTKALAMVKAALGYGRSLSGCY